MVDWIRAGHASMWVGAWLGRSVSSERTDLEKWKAGAGREIAFCCARHWRKIGIQPVVDCKHVCVTCHHDKIVHVSWGDGIRNHQLFCHIRGPVITSKTYPGFRWHHNKPPFAPTCQERKDYTARINHLTRKQNWNLNRAKHNGKSEFFLNPLQTNNIKKTRQNGRK